MKTTIVPAQITTVEDRIAGNLNLTQILLLLTPVFISSIVYIGFPPGLHFVTYKLLIILISVIICCFLAIRIKGKLVAQWIITYLRYNIRPRYYVCDKNDDYQRNIYMKKAKPESISIKSTVEKKIKVNTLPAFSIADNVKLDDIIGNPEKKVSFSFSKKGGLYVSLSEVKQ